MSGARLDIETLTRPGLGPVTLHLAAGESLAVTGPSGSGKTLLLRAIADLDPAEGTVRLDGTARTDLSPAEWRRRVRYVAAEPGWWTDMVAAHFRDPAAVRPELDSLGLDAGLMDAPVAQLSTGERQRLALLRALEGDPQILLLDEPTAALDSENVERVVRLLDTLGRRGIGLIIVAHDTAMTARLAGRHYHMAEGRLSPV